VNCPQTFGLGFLLPTGSQSIIPQAICLIGFSVFFLFRFTEFPDLGSFINIRVPTSRSKKVVMVGQHSIRILMEDLPFGNTIFIYP
jgi:hypothetical protein